MDWELLIVVGISCATWLLAMTAFVRGITCVPKTSTAQTTGFGHKTPAVTSGRRAA